MKNLLLPYLEAALEETLDNLKVILDSEELKNEDDLPIFLEMLQNLELEINSIGGTINPKIKEEINGFINFIQENDIIREGEEANVLNPPLSDSHES